MENLENMGIDHEPPRRLNGTSPKNMNSENGDLKIRLSFMRIQVNLESRNLNVKFQHGHVNIYTLAALFLDEMVSRRHELHQMPANLDQYL